MLQDSENMSTNKVGRISCLAPIADERSEALILGTFPGVKSLTKGEYYGNPQNHFWQILEKTLNIKKDSSFASKRNALLKKNIALWDVLKSCEREGSLDDAIKNEVPNNIPLFLKKHSGIRAIAFNGGNARKLAQREFPEIFSDKRYTLHM